MTVKNPWASPHSQTVTSLGDLTTREWQSWLEREPPWEGTCPESWPVWETDRAW